jgi:sugar/nucleoside kinase (ribokinase family)
MSIIGIGLSNIDLVAHVAESFLAKHKVQKGLATKFGDLPFARLRADLAQFDAMPGGCAANTLCGLSALGAHCRFYGKIGQDSFESLYRASFREYGVAYDVVAGHQESSQCAVLVTPDGERSFAYTYGASWALRTKDIDWDDVRKATAIIAEIYMLEFERGTLAEAVFDAARERKIPVVIKVMDRDFALRHADQLIHLAREKPLSLIVGNHENIPAMTGTDNLAGTIEALKDFPGDVLLTANRDGAYYISNGRAEHFPAQRVEKPKNTTEAGDQFLAGFLLGRLDGKPIPECMAFAAASARAILMQDTARPPLAGKHGIRF